MTVQEAINIITTLVPKTCKMVDGRLKGGFYDWDSDAGKALKMAIEALEKQISVEEALERLERLRECEETGDCPKDGMCDGGNCDTCYMDTAIQIIKEECGINATQNSSETQHTATNCCNMEHIKQRFERVM